MQDRNTKGNLGSQALSAVKYVFAMAMFGTMVLIVVATYMAAN
jgi:hypothetical protein